MEVVGTMFLKNKCLLIDKPRKRLTYQMIGGKVEDGETPLKAAIRECHEELGDKAIFDENSLDLVMEFDEIATSDGITPIHFYVFRYNGVLEGELSTSLEIEKFLWYQSNAGEEILSNTLSLIVLPNFAATRDENIIIKTAQTILINAIPSIDNPVLAIYLLLIFPVSIPIA